MGGSALPARGASLLAASAIPPALLLALFFCQNVLDAADRVVPAAAFDQLQALIRTSLNTDTPDVAYGALSSAFIVGFSISAAVVGHIAARVQPMYILCVCNVIWIASLVLCATASTSYTQLLVGRIVSGVGEAASIAIIPPLISEIAPAGKSGRWLAIYFMGLPFGIAVGFIGGAQLSARFGWYRVYAMELGIAIPLTLALIGITLQARRAMLQQRVAAAAQRNAQGDEVETGGVFHLSSSPVDESTPVFDAGDEDDSHAPFSSRTGSAAPTTAAGAHAASPVPARGASIRAFFRDVARILRDPVFVMLILGGAGYHSVTAASGTYVSMFVRDVGLVESVAQAASSIGSILLVAGIGGAFYGGMLLDAKRAVLCRCRRRPAQSLASALESPTQDGSEGEGEGGDGQPRGVVDEGSTTGSTSAAAASAQAGHRKPRLALLPSLRIMSLHIWAAFVFLSLSVVAVATMEPGKVEPAARGGYFIAIALGTIVSFVMTTPYQAAVMSAAPSPELAPLALGISQLAIHLLGDVPFNPIIGAILTALAPPVCPPSDSSDGAPVNIKYCQHPASGVKLVMVILYAVLLIPCALWTGALLIQLRRRRRGAVAAADKRRTATSSTLGSPAAQIRASINSSHV